VSARSVVHCEVIAADGARARGFYSSLFDWDLPEVPGGYSLVRPGEGPSVGIGEFGGPGHVTFYVAVPDLAEALERAGRLGGRTVMEPRVVAEGVEVALLADPEGHVVGLMKS
jgi:predicted enzyme related to lactoylglutathione lyase